MDFDEDLKQIDDYLSGQLSKEQVVLFDNRRKTDSLFEKKVQEEILLRKGIEFSHIQAAFEDIQKAESKVKTVSHQKWLLAAASLVIAISSVILFFDQNQLPSELFDRYYEAFPNIITENVRGTEQPKLLSSAFDKYDSLKYTEAKVLFEQLRLENEYYADFYLGVCHLALEAPNEAIKNFESYLRKDSTFKNEANWYLGLSYLKKDNPDQAIRYFDLIDSQHSLGPKAKELLSELR